MSPAPGPLGSVASSTTVFARSMLDTAAGLHSSSAGEYAYIPHGRRTFTSVTDPSPVSISTHLLRRAVVGGDGLARGVVREHHLLALVLVLLLLEQLDGVVVQLAVRRQLLDAELDLPLRKCSREW